MSLVFDRLVGSALLLAWGCEERSDGVPPELLEEWLSQIQSTEAFLADVKAELGRGDVSSGPQSVFGGGSGSRS
jgi:hypothetical protein